MKLILKYILWFPWEMDSSGFAFNSSFELKPKERKERIYQCVLSGCPCSLRKWATESLQRPLGLRIDVGGKWGWEDNLGACLFFHLHHCWGKTKAETFFLGTPPKSLSAPALRCSPLGVSPLTARAWENHAQVVGSSGGHCVGHWLPAVFPWEPALPPHWLTVPYNLKWMSNRFFMFSVWRGRHRQPLTPAHCSWGNNASHSSSGAPRSLGILQSTKETVTETYS